MNAVQLLYDQDTRHTSDGHPVTVSSGAIATFQGWVRSTTRFLAYFSGVGIFGRDSSQGEDASLEAAVSWSNCIVL